MTPQPRERYDLPTHHGLAGFVFVDPPSHKNGSGTDAVQNFENSRTGKASQQFLPSQFYVLTPHRKPTRLSFEDKQRD